MKNIHILQTDKASRLHYFTANKAGYYLYTNKLVVPRNPNYINQNIYITNSEEIKEGSIVKIPCGVGRVKELNWKYGNDFPSYVVEDIFTYKLRYGQKESELQINSFNYEDVKKIILTTDQELIQDGIQGIPDEFLEWFVKNPSCETIEVNKIYNDYGETDIFDLVCTPHSFKYKITIPKEEPKFDRETQNFVDGQSKKIKDWVERNKDNIPKEELSKDEIDRFFVDMVCNSKKEPKKETLEEVAERLYPYEVGYGVFDRNCEIDIERERFVEGVKYQQEQDKKLWSDEEVFSFVTDLVKNSDFIDFNKEYGVNGWGELAKWFEQNKK